MITLPTAPIDVWNPRTYDPELQGFLAEASPLITDYWQEDRRLDAERAADGHRGAPVQNRYGPAYSQLRDSAAVLVGERRVRAYHYTRLIPREVEAIRHGGMQPMTMAAIKARLALLVEEGLIDAATAEALFASSCYHQQVGGNRENRIWLTTHPYPTDYDGVSELLGKWGGESVAFNHIEGPMGDTLAAIGTPAIVEVDLPLWTTTRAFSVAGCILDTQAKALGLSEGWDSSADLVAVEPLAPDWIRAIHLEGEATYKAFGRTYPDGIEA
ncbi:hypothetical protein [Sphingopyxis sp. 22461]|uniref:hypothetical protein n=1 Tax=Sphingopyxis sp. 22461 TaxID=3453923 RepID=UPI003F84F029